MNGTTETCAAEKVLTSGKFQGARVRDIADREELALHAARGGYCAREDRDAMRAYIRSLWEQQRWIGGRRDRPRLPGGHPRRHKAPRQHKADL